MAEGVNLFHPSARSQQSWHISANVKQLCAKLLVRKQCGCERRARLLAVSRCPRETAARRFIKMEVSNPKFSDIKAIPRALRIRSRLFALPWGIARRRWRKLTRVKMRKPYLAGWLMKSRMLINAHFLKLFTSKRRARGIWLQKLPPCWAPTTAARAKLHPPTQPPFRPEHSSLHDGIKSFSSRLVRPSLLDIVIWIIIACFWHVWIDFASFSLFFLGYYRTCEV
jgi:hypothetical protein